MSKKTVKDTSGHDIVYEPTPGKKRPGDDPAFIKKSRENKQKRTDFVKENSEYHKKTPKSVRDKSPFADATETNDMRPKNSENLKARKELHKVIRLNDSIFPKEK